MDRRSLYDYASRMIISSTTIRENTPFAVCAVGVSTSRCTWCAMSAHNLSQRRVGARWVSDMVPSQLSRCPIRWCDRRSSIKLRACGVRCDEVDCVGVAIHGRGRFGHAVRCEPYLCHSHSDLRSRGVMHAEWQNFKD